ncbi:MAG TPA: type II toxin-antitoxin system RelE/ParE family toxin, partial [Burkholderiaceae bacterium]|nr:type II toxin-antitoxin system RelE/ParE family toxin [Burkholderiaceae bacterium]
PLKGFGGAGVLEVVENDEGGTCFRKKSKSGIAMPKEDKAVIETRLKAAAERIKEIRDGKASR